jgi:predicted ATPase
MMNNLIPLTPPEAPDFLLEACAANECVLFAGAGLSARAGFPTWVPFVRSLLQWAVDSGFIDETSAESHRAAIEKGDVDSVSDAIVSCLQSREYLLHDFLIKTFSTVPPLSEAHLILREIKFSAVLTTNFDYLMEETFISDGLTGGNSPNQKTNVYTPSDTTSLLEALHKRDFFILKLFGSLLRLETLMISPAQFEDTIRDNLPFRQFMDTLFFSRTMLFVGASIEGIEDYLKGVGLGKRSRARQHCALVAVSGDGWQAKAAQLKRRYGINVIPYPYSESHAEVLEFLSDLKQKVEHLSVGHEEVSKISRLKHITLENIGPFEHLELPLDANWNIMLGDNGVGKSSILKAVAVAICGKDSQAFAGRLIKAGKTKGSITLVTEHNTYKTELFGTINSPAEVVSTPGRPLEAEGWLAIGFPPLRTLSWERPKAPDQIAQGLPSAEDLMPLVRGGADPRLDNLKQWIVNIDYRSKHEQATNGDSRKFERLLDKFFQDVGSLTQGLTISRGEVNPVTYEITVLTDDGPLPIEAISQGMISLIGWVGILMQRMYEIYSDDEEPTERYAVVLMDEIDAHLHPEWQRTLVRDLTKIFPNVQFIATTHSPLIVAGMPARQIFRFARDEDGQVAQIEVTSEMTMGRADQILKGGLFGLETTLGTSTEEKIERYQTLLGKASLLPEEEEKLRELERSVRFRIPIGEEEKPGDHQVQEVAQALLLKQAAETIKQTFPEDSRSVTKMAEKLLAEAGRRVEE